MIDFELEEWEWPDASERAYTIEPFEFQCRWPDGLRPTVVTAVPAKVNEKRVLHLVFFRPLSPSGERFQTVFNYVSRHSGSRWLLTARGVEESKEAAQLQLQEHLGGDFMLRPARFFELPHSSALIEEEVGVWGRNRVFETRFRLPFRNSEQSGAQIYQWLQCQESEALSQTTMPAPTLYQSSEPELSEPVFAYLWDDKKWSDKVGYLANLETLQQEWKHLRDLISRMEAELTSHTAWYTSLSEGWPGVKVETLLGRKRVFLDSPSLLQRLNIWEQIFKRVFAPYPFSSATPLCIPDSYMASYRLTASQLGEDTSAHERLEALLALREWAKDKATSEEMALLFPAT